MPVWEKSSPAGVKDSGEGGNKCEQKRGKKGERECSEALKSRGGPADIFYVHVEEKKRQKKKFCSRFLQFHSDEVCSV